jgi:hypothetical protein
MAEISVEVRVSGLLPEDALEELGDLSVTTTTATTVLAGTVTDQAALLGLLARLRAQGLTVTEVRRVPAARETPPDERTDTTDERSRKEQG